MNERSENRITFKRELCSFHMAVVLVVALKVRRVVGLFLDSVEISGSPLPTTLLFVVIVPATSLVLSPSPPAPLD